MRSRQYPIIKPVFTSQKAKLLKVIFNLIIVLICFSIGLLLGVYIHVVFIAFWAFIFILPIILEPLLMKKLYPFEVVGYVICEVDRLVFTIANIEETYFLKEIKGFNIGLLITNPAVHSHALDSKHNAYHIILKCSLDRQLSFYVFNYQDSTSIKNDFYDTNFLGELKHYSKVYKIRFWDMEGSALAYL